MPPESGLCTLNIMGLYETLADVYDDVFPVNPMTLSFIGAPSRSGARLLDLGCATGGHALALAEAGWTAVGLEPSSTMLAAAKAKARLAPPGTGKPEFLRGGMLDLDRLFERGKFALVLCLGNTLPHLDGPPELERFLLQSRRILEPGGRMVIQLLNYRRILEKRPESLPDIRIGSVDFKRAYRYRKDGLIDFQTSLKDGVTRSDVTTLFPFLPGEVRGALTGAGFALGDSLGSWSGSPFDERNDAFIILDARAPAF